jgi:NAD(P)H-nitrite reductase large subunit
LRAQYSDLSGDLSDEQALEKISQVLAYYKETAKKGERLGKMIDRLGFDTVKAALS